MTEPTSRPAAKVPAAQERAQSDLSLDTIVSIQAQQLSFNSFGDYCRALSIHSRIVNTEDADEIKKSLKASETVERLFERLETMTAKFVLHSLMLNSSALTDAERTDLDIQKHYKAQAGKPVLRRSCGEALASWLAEPKEGLKAPNGTPLKKRSVEACVREASRIIDAAIVYGLVEHDPTRKPRKNNKPVRATGRLVAMMKDAAGPSACMLMRLIEAASKR